MPNKVDLADLSLFLTFFENPVTIVIVILVWITFTLLQLWARRQDREDQAKVRQTLKFKHVLL